MKNLHPLEWFIVRIGKRVYRDANNPPCGCKTCNDVEEHGMIITDEQHARYLFEVQNEFAQYSKQYFNYRDTKNATD